MSGLIIHERAKAAEHALNTEVSVDGVTPESKKDAYIKAVLAHRELHAAYQNRNSTDNPPTREDLDSLENLQAGINKLGKEQGFQDKYDPNEALPKIVKEHLENIAPASTQPSAPTLTQDPPVHEKEPAPAQDIDPPVQASGADQALQPPSAPVAATSEQPSPARSSASSTTTAAEVEPAAPPPPTTTPTQFAAHAAAHKSGASNRLVWMRSPQELQDMTDMAQQPASHVGMLKASQVKLLGKDQVEAMTAAQVNALCPRRLLNDTRSRIWGRKIKKLQVEHLSAEAVAGIDVRVLQRMSRKQIKDLDTSEMNAAQVNGLSPKTASSLFRRWVNPPELRALDVEKLPQDTVNKISPKQIQRMSKEQIEKINVQGMTAAQVNALSPMKWRNVDKRWFGEGSTQLHALKVGGLRKGVARHIKLRQLRRMSVQQIGDFRPDQVAEMSAKTLRGLMPYRMQLYSVGKKGIQNALAVSPDQDKTFNVKGRMFARVRALNMSEVSPDVIPKLGARFVGLLTPVQVNSMTAAQFNKMYGGNVFSQLGSLGNRISSIKEDEFGKISGRTMSNFRAWQIRLVTKEQTQKMTVQQLEGLARPWPTWKSSIRNLKHITEIQPTQIAQLSTKAIRCFSAKQIDSFTVEQRGALQDKHFNAMNRDCLQKLDVQSMSAEAVAGLRLNDRVIGSKTSWHGGETQRLSKEQLTEVLNERTSNLSAKQLNGLWPNQWQMMQPESIGKISPETFGRLTAGRIAGCALSNLSDKQILNITPDQIDAMQFGRRYITSGEKVKWLDNAIKKVGDAIKSIESEMNTIKSEVSTIKAEIANLENKDPQDDKKIEAKKAELEKKTAELEKKTAEKDRLEGLQKSMQAKRKQVPAPLASRVASGIASAPRQVADAAARAYQVGVTGAAKGMREVIMRGTGLRSEIKQSLGDALSNLGGPEIQERLAKAIGLKSITSLGTLSESQQAALQKNVEAMHQSSLTPDSFIKALEERKQVNGSGRMGMETMANVIEQEKDNAVKQAFMQNGCSEQDARAAAKFAKARGLDAATLQDPNMRAKCIQDIPALQTVPEAQRVFVAQALASNVAQPGENGAPQNSRSDLVAVAKAAGAQITSSEQLQTATAQFSVERQEFRENHGLTSQKAELAAIVMQSPEGRKASSGENPPQPEDVAAAARQANSTTSPHADVVQEAAKLSAARAKAAQQSELDQGQSSNKRKLGHN